MALMYRCKPFQRFWTRDFGTSLKQRCSQRRKKHIIILSLKNSCHVCLFTLCNFFRLFSFGEQKFKHSPFGSECSLYKLANISLFFFFFFFFSCSKWYNVAGLMNPIQTASWNVSIGRKSMSNNIVSLNWFSCDTIYNLRSSIEFVHTEWIDSIIKRQSVCTEFFLFFFEFSLFVHAILRMSLFYDICQYCLKK